MSSSGIPITVDLMFQADEAVRQAWSFRDEMRAIAMDLDAEPIRVPLTLRDDIARAQMDVLREQLQAIPIVIPLQLDTAGFTEQLATYNATIAASMPALLAASEPVTAMMASALSGGSGMSPGLPMPVGFGVAGDLTRANFSANEIAAVQAQEAGILSRAELQAIGDDFLMRGRAAEAEEEAVSGPSGPMDSGNGTNFFGSGFRGVMHAAIVARAGYDTARAVGYASRAAFDGVGGAYDPSGSREAGWGRDSESALADVAAGEDAVRKIPLVGPMAQGIGDSIYRFGEAAINKQFSDAGGGQRRIGRGPEGFESDEGYAERMAAEQKKIDESIEARDKEIKARVAATEHLEAETLKVNRNIDMMGIGGSFERGAKADVDELAEVDKQLENEKFHTRAPGHPLTAEAAEYRAAKVRQFAARQREREGSRDAAEVDIQAQDEELGDEANGNMAAADRVRYQRQLDREQVDAYAKGKDVGDNYRDVVRPAKTSRFDSQAATDVERAQDEHNMGMRSIQAATDEVGARSKGMNAKADLDTKNFSLDRQLQEKEDEMNRETDSRRKAQLQLELQALDAYTTNAKAQNAKEYEHQRSLRYSDIGERTKEINMRTKGHGQQADEAALEYGIRREIEEEADPALKAQLAREGAARLRNFGKADDHAAIYGSLGEYANRIQTDVLNNDPKAEKAAKEAAEKMQKAADSWQAIADDIGQDHIVVLDI